MPVASRNRNRDRSRPNAWRTTSAKSRTKRWNASSIPWCICWRGTACSAASWWSPSMAANCRRAIRYEGCGMLKATRSVKVKGQKEAATEEYYVYGWKLLVLIEVQTRLPLAMKLVTIQDDEGKWLVPLLEQAQH